MKRKMISLLLSISLILALLPGTALAAGLPFTDVSANAWYHDAVEYVYENNIMSGTGMGKFSPETYLTRAQLCQLLYNMEGAPKGASSTFTDVAKTAWYYDAVSWASAQSIVSGVGNNKFDPNSNITREQMATILYRYSAAKGYDTEDIVDISDFADADSVSGWAKAGVQWAVGEGLIQGVTATSLSPKGMSSRAVAATIIMRFRQRIEAIQAFEAKNIDDFQGYEVINFDESDETNFAVLTEDAVVSETDGNINQLVSRDEENGIFVFSNIDKTISGLSAGDIFYITYGSGEDDYLLLKVGDIKIDGTTATITESNAELSDYFTYIDVDMDVGVTEEDFNPTGMGSGVTYLGASSPRAYSTLGGDKSSDLFKFHVSDGALDATVQVQLTVSLKIQYEWKLWHLLPDVHDIKASIKQDSSFDGKIAASSKQSFKKVLCNATIPIASGLEAQAELYVTGNMNAAGNITVNAKTSTEKGVKWHNGDLKVIDNSDSDFFVDAGGKFDASLGVGANATIIVLAVIRTTGEAEGGVSLTAVIDAPGLSSDSTYSHDCSLCIDGATKLYGRASFDIALGISDKLSKSLVDKSFNGELSLADFYVSFLNSSSAAEFGLGDCPHKKYLVTVTAQDSYGKRVAGATITLSDAETGNIAYTGTTNSDGVYKVYCENGVYSISAFGLENYDASEAKNLTVNGKAASAVAVLPIKTIATADYTCIVNDEELRPVGKAGVKVISDSEIAVEMDIDPDAVSFDMGGDNRFYIEFFSNQRDDADWPTWQFYTLVYPSTIPIEQQSDEPEPYMLSRYLDEDVNFGEKEEPTFRESNLKVDSEYHHVSWTVKIVDANGFSFSRLKDGNMFATFNDELDTDRYYY